MSENTLPEQALAENAKPKDEKFKGRFGVVRTGVNVLLFDEKGRFVMGIRKGSHGANTWGLPGGHIDLRESFEDCAIRELDEETGLAIVNIKFLTVTNDVFEEAGKHYTTNFLVAQAKYKYPSAVVLEPKKCERWEWFTWKEVKKYYEAGQPSNNDKYTKFDGKKLFLPTENLFKTRPDVRPWEKLQPLWPTEKKMESETK
ncbi:Nudix hydrolase 15, mitochondrial [Aspergillus alliaceus]|uniref:Nudix hydrolase 15, mitochondrial n=1 Tax=Petromyces alliaceus TaxID=209559 RepID=A0A8H6A3E3_PETAA|nr:Nudix hydrolase 15, mitochondrial [Aspergillus burnettii]